MSEKDEFKQYVDEIEADKSPLGSDNLGKINLLIRLKELLLARGEAEEEILRIYIKYREYKQARL